MALIKFLRIVLTAAFVVFVGGIILGAALGQPVFLTYVETGSMEPTLSPGDGFVAVPSSISGEIERGDVVIYDSKHADEGGYTTHRVVEVNEEGYIQSITSTAA